MMLLWKHLPTQDLNYWTFGHLLVKMACKVDLLKANKYQGVILMLFSFITFIILGQTYCSADLLLGMVRWLWLCGWSDSPSSLDPLVDLSAPRRLLKISGMYIFPMLQLQAGLLILIWMASELDEHINQEGMENFLKNTCFIPKDKLISLWN